MFNDAVVCMNCNKKNLTIIEKHFCEQELLRLLLHFDDVFIPPFSCSIDLEQYAKKLQSHAFFICSVYGDKIVGILAYYKNTEINQLYIPYICVDPSMQGWGIGTDMIDFLVNKYLFSFSDIALEVLKTNMLGLSFYEKNGFHIMEDRGEKFLLKKSFVNYKNKVEH